MSYCSVFVPKKEAARSDLLNRTASFDMCVIGVLLHLYMLFRLRVLQILFLKQDLSCHNVNRYVEDLSNL